MKKYLSAVLAASLALGAATLALGCLSACGGNKDAAAAKVASTSETAQDNKLQIVTTIFPEYDWAKEILGEDADYAELTLLLDDGVDLHSFQPTADDILKISTCDVFIYVGGESDAWVEDALAEAVNQDMKVINLLDVLGSSVKEEEVVEGMEAEEEGEVEEEGPEYDEHVWLSLRNAQVLCSAIADALSDADPEHADSYQENATAYNKKLSDLDTCYREAVDAASIKTVLFGDRFPFRYLVDDYGLSYYAAFVGCSAESEASFETIAFLAGKVDELGLGTVLTIEKSDQKIARAIVRNTQAKDQQILALDSMQSTTSDDIAAGASYLSIMESNLDVLQDALN